MDKRLFAWTRNTKFWLGLQVVALAAGNFVGWTTISREVDTFCAAQGSGLWGLTDFSGTAVRNPVASACFWGSIVFALSFAWTVWVLLSGVEAVRANVRRLWWVLLGGTIFALANNVPIFYRFYTQPKGGVVSACTTTSITNPFATSCFLGFSAFAAAFLFASLAKMCCRKLKIGAR